MNGQPWVRLKKKSVSEKNNVKMLGIRKYGVTLHVNVLITVSTGVQYFFFCKLTSGLAYVFWFCDSSGDYQPEKNIYKQQLYNRFGLAIPDLIAK